MAQKGELHIRNKHNGQYDFPLLIENYPPLKRFVSLNPLGVQTINFFNPQAVIHDGARAFITSELIEFCIDQVKKDKTCVMGMPVKDTIKIVDEDRYAVSTPPRSTMWQIQTPQCFVTAEIREAYQKMMEAGDDSVTDDGMVMETYGIRGVRMIKGSYENMKITTPEDMLLGEAILKGRSTER